MTTVVLSLSRVTCYLLVERAFPTQSLLEHPQINVFAHDNRSRDAYQLTIDGLIVQNPSVSTFIRFPTA